MPWAFLVVSLVGAWFTYNAHVPRLRRGPLVVPSFFAGWLTAELAAHHVSWQAAATVAFIWFGALSAWPGWLGLGITLLSWLGLFALMSTAERTRDTVERALVRGLGDDYSSRISPGLAARTAEPAPRGRLLLPFALFDKRVKVTRHIPYAPEHGVRGQLDVYAPREGTENAPVLLQIHGGAWIISKKEHQALPLMLHLAAQGWICVSANYRLSPRATFPEHLLDLKRAIAWIRSNIASFGGDPGFLTVTGGSAGGHLSALVALTGNDPEYQPGFEEVDTTVDACVPFYGVYDFTNQFGSQPDDGLQQLLEMMVMKQRLEDDPEAFRKASPLHRIHPGAPPFFVVHGSHDSLAPVGEARLFVEQLRKTSEAPVAYAELAGAQHAFEVFHSIRTTHTVQAVDRFLASVYSAHRAGTPLAKPG